jgi:RecJ-like exonuclease
MKNFFSLNEVDMRYIPFIASAIPAYTRSLEKKAEMKNKKKVSEFVGEIGDKISADVEVIGSKKVSGFYGPTLFVRMVDTDGNTFTTFYSGYNAEPEIGDKISISGTVKKHDIFKGWKSTILKRVKFSS